MELPAAPFPEAGRLFTDSDKVLYGPVKGGGVDSVLPGGSPGGVPAGPQGPVAGLCSFPQNAVFAAVIKRGDTGEAEEYTVKGKEVAFVFQGRRYPVYIVVVREVVKACAPVYPFGSPLPLQFF